MVFGLRPSPAILGAVIARHCKQYESDHFNVTEKLTHSLYVDDLITGEETIEGAYKLYQQAKQMMSDGGFNIRKWNSNSLHLMKKIAEHEATLTEGKADKPDCPTCNIPESDDQAYLSKLLGITWDSQADEFMFKLNDLKVIDESSVSKRSLLRITASIQYLTHWIS